MSLTPQDQLDAIREAKAGHLETTKQLRTALGARYERIHLLTQQELKLTASIEAGSIVINEKGELFKVAEIGCNFETGQPTLTGISLPEQEGAEAQPLQGGVRLANGEERAQLEEPKKKPRRKKMPSKAIEKAAAKALAEAGEG